MKQMLALWGMGSGELIIIVVAIVILFGARRIPEFARGLGQGIKEFKKSSRDDSDDKPGSK